MNGMRCTRFVQAAAAAILAALGVPAHAQQSVKVGLILPLTGPFASTGRQVEAAARLYLRTRCALPGGARVELVVKDDTGVPDVTKRLAQELVIRDKVHVLAGFGLTPLALAAAPVATEAKVPMIVMASGTLIIPSRSPYIVRSAFTLPQNTAPIAEWAARNGIRTVVTLVTDYAPGLDSEKTFIERFKSLGGQVLEQLRVPLRNPDYAPFLQRAKDAKPDALFVFIPSGEGAAVMKQFAERGLRESGTRLIGTGDLTDDDILNGMGAPAIGTVTSHHYSAAHPSPENRSYVEAFEKANPGMRPNYMSVGGYDGMHLVCEALRKTGAIGAAGAPDGDRLVEAMKGMSWESPRGPMSIDAATRDVTQNVYIRRVEPVNGHLYNVEFETFENVKASGLR